MTAPSSTTSARCSVLIVGAGPTGLALAGDLARWGVHIRLVDASPAAAPHSRAIAVQARTLELMEQRGIADAMVEEGLPVARAIFHASHGRTGELRFDHVPSRYAFALTLDQAVTERILAADVEAHGVTIERAVTLVDFEERSDGVHARLQHADGRIETVVADYLVGCDGAHSTVRRTLGLDFSGYSYPSSYVLADVRLDWDAARDAAHFYTPADGFVAFFPLADDRWRIVADFGEGSVPSTPPSVEDIRALLAHRLERSVGVHDLVWSSYFHINSRLVTTLRRGRVFVAGDSAHIHSPAGGQGMNTGMQDAINLAWKLALVTRHRAPLELLHSYDAERHPVEADVLKLTDATFKFITSRNFVARTLRDLVMPTAMHIDALRRAVARRGSETAIAYTTSELTLEAEEADDGGPRAGDRAPDAVLVGDPAGRTLYRAIDPAAFTLLVVGAEMTAPPHRLVRVVRCDDAAPIDAREEMRAPYGDARGMFYLIRPDGYIAVRGRAGRDDARAAEWLARWAPKG